MSSLTHCTVTWFIFLCQKFVRKVSSSSYYSTWCLQVYKLTAEGIAFRFLPDPAQIKNAIEVNITVVGPFNCILCHVIESYLCVLFKEGWWCCLEDVLLYKERGHSIWFNCMFIMIGIYLMKDGFCEDGHLSGIFPFHKKNAIIM